MFVPESEDQPRHFILKIKEKTDFFWGGGEGKKTEFLIKGLFFFPLEEYILLLGSSFGLPFVNKEIQPNDLFHMFICFWCQKRSYFNA